MRDRPGRTAAAWAALTARTMLAACLGVALLAGAPRAEAEAEAADAEVVPGEVRLLPLAGPITSPDAEISALCWCGDNLVMVPQHPERFGRAEGELLLLTVTRAEILAVVDGAQEEPLRPRPLVLEAPGLIAGIPGWDGLEAIASRDDTIYLAAETEHDGRMGGMLLRGRVSPGTGPLRMRVEPGRLAPVPLPHDLPNMSQEALIMAPGQVVVLFEANGVMVNPDAHAAVFDTDLNYQGTAPLDPVEYRITDATDVDADGRFWVINYFFPGEARVLRPPDVPATPVEHLLEMQLRDGRITRTGRAPLDLRTDPQQPARNWEALARLPGRGFLLMTDRYPATLLAFVPDPELASGR
jgi:hypothetical protein